MFAHSWHFERIRRARIYIRFVLLSDSSIQRCIYVICVVETPFEIVTITPNQHIVLFIESFKNVVTTIVRYNLDPVLVVFGVVIIHAFEQYHRGIFFSAFFTMRNTLYEQGFNSQERRPIQLDDPN